MPANVPLSTYNLTFKCSRGSVYGSSVILDNLKIRRTQRFTNELADYLEELGVNSQSYGNDSQVQEEVELPIEEPEEEDSAVSDNYVYARTAEIVLLCVIIILALGIVFLGLKYWHLRQEVYASYSVSSSGGMSSSASSNAGAKSGMSGRHPPPQPVFDNPLYSGHHMSAERYGTIQE